jgi:hypothetical protein
MTGGSTYHPDRPTALAAHRPGVASAISAQSPIPADRPCTSPGPIPMLRLQDLRAWPHHRQLPCVTAMERSDGQAYWPPTVSATIRNGKLRLLLTRSGFSSSGAHDHPELLIDPRNLHSCQVINDDALDDRRPARSARRVQDRRRRDRMRAAGPVESFTSGEIGDRDGWVCGTCRDMARLVDPSPGAPRALSPSIDHIVAISDAGTHTRPTCRSPTCGATSSGTTASHRPRSTCAHSCHGS